MGGVMMNSHKREVLLLGTYHMANNGLDLFNVEAEDVLEGERQQEIQEVVDRLKQFNPTKIAVERLAEQGESLHKDYQAYVAGNFRLTANEIHQLGFRTAAELGHDQIYSVDWNKQVGDVGLGHVLTHAEDYFPDLYKKLHSSGEDGVTDFQKAQEKLSIRELLVGANDPHQIQKEQEQYMMLARVGDGESKIGIDWLCNYWYRRNMIIYANIERISTKNDRVLVIYGAGHLHLLTQFMKESGLFSLNSVEKYLG